MIRVVGASALLASALAMPLQDAAAQDPLGGAILGGAAGAILGGAMGGGRGAAVGAIIGGAQLSEISRTLPIGSFYWGQRALHPSYASPSPHQIKRL